MTLPSEAVASRAKYAHRRWRRSVIASTGGIGNCSWAWAGTARFDALLAGDAVRLLYVWGAGGIGKSTLLRAMGRRASDAGYEVVNLNGRDLPPFPSVLDEALAPAIANDRTLVVIDSYEMISSLDGWLREVVIPDLRDSTVVVFGSRQRPSPGWFEGGWDAVFESMALEGLSTGESADTRRHASGVARVRDRAAREAGPRVTAGGHDRTARGRGGSVGDLADRLLGHEVDSDRYRTLSVAAIARVTTPELIEAVQPGTDGQDAYKWLADRSFTEPLANGVALHALVAEAVRGVLAIATPTGEGALRRRIADFLYERALAGQFSLSADLQHLVVDPRRPVGVLGRHRQPLPRRRTAAGRHRDHRVDPPRGRPRRVVGDHGGLLPSPS